MSGQLVGQVNVNGRRLKAAGVPRLAARALSVVAECCRDHNRLGPVPLEYLAGAMEGAGERTASRALLQLRELGLIAVARRGGGRGHTGRPTVYRIADVDQWLTDRGVPAAPVAAQSAELAEFGRHDGGESIPFGGDSIADPGPFLPDSLATSGDSIRENGESIGDPLAISGRLSRHPGGEVPVPVRTPGVETGDVAGGQHELVDERPPPRRSRPRAETPGQLPLVAPVRELLDVDDVADGSWCGRADCRSPEPCGACGRARQHQQAVAHRAEHDRIHAERQAVRDQAAARAAAAAACPHRCVDGYLGLRVCDHVPRRPVQTMSGWQLARSIADNSAARAAARKRDGPRPLVPRLAPPAARAAS